MVLSLMNTKKWTRDEFRLFVILLLIFLYPVFVSSFFALYLFVFLPFWLPPDYSLKEASTTGFYHFYWLFVALLWVVLCALILPCFWDKTDIKPEEIRLDMRGSPSYPTKAQTVQPFVQVEASCEKTRHSVITGKSDSSSESIEKGVCEEKAENESLEKSRESLQKSCTSLERSRITQSGEFLNEFIETVQADELKKDEAECEIHASDNKDAHEKNVESQGDEGKETEGKDNKDQGTEGEKKEGDSSSSEKDISISDEEFTVTGKEEKDKVNQENLDKDKSSALPKDSSEDKIEPTIIEEKVKQQRATDPVQSDKDNENEEEDYKDHCTGGAKREGDSSSSDEDSSSSEEENTSTGKEKNDKVNQEAVPVQSEAMVLKSSPTEGQEEKVEELEEAPKLRGKARPTVETSRCSSYYECSMPTPRSANSLQPESNMVFLFVNPESLGTEEDVKVVHAGEVQTDETQKAD